ncbi:MAG: hypothetical protein WD770_09575 [Actinomycetota bacterium]
MRTRSVLVALALLGAACTGSPEPVPDPSFPPPSPKPGPRAAITLVGSFDDDRHTPYLEAARLAVREVNASPLPVTIDLQIVDHRGDAGRAGEGILESAKSSAAIVYAGPGAVLTGLRPELEPTRVPVVLLEGDLYTTRGLYTNVFQASMPLLWQARVIAKYLAVRNEAGATAVFDAEDLDGGRLAWSSAAAEEGVAASPEEPAFPEGYPIVLMGDPEQGPFGATPDQILSTDALLGLEDRDLAPGTGFVAPYTWSGWGEPVPRVRRFRDAFRAAFGRIPMGLEQQAYDAFRVLAGALAATRGEGGGPLIEQLERVHDRAYSSLPIRLGPDDHTLLDDFSIGVFAVAGPDEDIEPWMEGLTPWRPVMRSFTYDGERVVILERDRRPFFPTWRKPAPTPNYWRSLLGITTRPRDPLH